MKRTRFLLASLLLPLCLILLGACNTGRAPDGAVIGDEGNLVTGQPALFDKKGPKESRDDAGEQERFAALIDELFEDMVTTDTITMNFFLAHPEEMGIERPAVTYGEVMTAQLYEEEKAHTFEIFDKLSDIRYSSLSPDMQITYAIIRNSLELAVILEEREDFSYYTGYIRPLTGIQVQLPVLLAEFNFHTRTDIEEYLLLLADTIRYFDDIIRFERERAARGFFMTDANLEEVIGQLETFLASPAEDSFLISYVNEKIDSFPGLTGEQRGQYKAENRELVINNVYIAYENLLEAMISLKGVGPAPGGLASLPDGQRYAHASLSSRAGTNRTADELYQMTDYLRSTTLLKIGMILNSDSEVLSKYVDSETGQIAGGTAQEYLKVLQNAIAQDFPPVGDVNYTVMEIHESLSEFMSPAFFLVPAVDIFDNNVIYINPSTYGEGADSNLNLFTVLAHEGYPGHMYQMVNLRRQSLHPIRIMLSNTGYTEGWATYAEMLSYGYTELSDNEAALMRELNLYFMILQSQIDLGVNLYGWGKEEIAQLLLSDLGVDDEEYVDNYYNAVTGVPLNISMYSLGYAEMMNLRAEAEQAWGDDFSLYRFHEFILNFGPAPYYLIGEYIRE